MKCFTVKSGDQYIIDRPQVISNSYWDGANILVVEEEDEAKHYKSNSGTKNWLVGATKRCKKQLQEYENAVAQNQAKQKLNPRHQQYYLRGSITRRDRMQKIVNWLTSAEVVEIDVEFPNHVKTNKLRWIARWRSDNTNHPSNMKMEQHSHSRFHCKACGLKLKNVPFYTMPDGNNTRVCVPCLYLRMDAIKKAYEGMDEDHRESITNEHLLGAI
jgi:hypothetical protein